MSKIEEIKQRLDKGYTLSIYGTRELLYEQMEEDINSLLILFRAKNKAIENRIEELGAEKFDTTTKHGLHDFNVNSAIINELKNLLIYENSK